MSEKIKVALGQLDIDNDEQWTTEGLPAIEAVKNILGENVTRAEITAAAKGFSRKTPNLEIEEPENTGSGEVVDAQTESTEETEDTSQASNETEETPPSEDQPAENNAVIEQPSVEPDPVETVSPSLTAEVMSEAAIMAEYTAAQQNLEMAKRRLKRAAEAKDDLVLKKEEANKRSPAEDIKAYQQSQMKQRAGRAGMVQALQVAVKANSTKF